MFELHRPLHQQIARVGLPRARVADKLIGLAVLLARLNLHELLKKKIELLAFLERF